MVGSLEQEVERLVERQIGEWPEAAARYAALDTCAMRLLDVEQSTVVLQYNPGRQRSAAAPVAPDQLAQRPCFLCSANQPREQQAVLWQDRYKLQVNPFPIFDRHLTITDLHHAPQRLDAQRLIDMIDLADALPKWQLFFNGAQCGASAPDHFHFQATSREVMPIGAEIATPTSWVNPVTLVRHDDGSVTATRIGRRPCIIATATTKTLLQYYFGRILLALVEGTGQADPMLNALCWVDDRRGTVVVIARRRHRPACYGTGVGQMLLSPGATEMGGWWAIACEQDYQTLTAGQVSALYDELCVDDDTFDRIIDSFTKQTND